MKGDGFPDKAWNGLDNRRYELAEEQTMKEKKEFKQAEIEVMRFEKDDVIATSNTGSTIPADHITTEPFDEEPGEL